MLLYNRLHGALLCLIQALTRLKTLTYHRYEPPLSVLNIRLYIYLITPFLFHVLPFKASAQVAESKAVDLTSLGLQIGQQVPDLTLTNVHNYKSTSINLSDFKGKLLILDFWATWCSPCVAMIPKMDSLQKKCGDKVQFLSVTYQKDEEVLPFLEKFEKQKGRHYTIPLVTADKELHGLFPHRTLPHYVWIDGEGKVYGITRMDEINYPNLLRVIEGDRELIQKNDYQIPYDISKPFLIDNNGGTGENVIYHSVLTSYTKGLGLFMTIRPNDGNRARITCSNYSILQLFQTAYSGKGNPFYSNYELSVLNVNEKHKIHSDLTGKNYVDWLSSGNGFCYELIVPLSLKNDIREIMKQDLAKLFPQYTAEVRTVKDSVWLIRSVDSLVHAVKQKGKPNIEIGPFDQRIENATIGQWVNRINLMQATPYKLVDETGWRHPVYLELEASPSDFKKMGEELAKYGLSIIKAQQPVQKLVVSDKIQ